MACGRKRLGNGDKNITQVTDTCRPCNYRVTACCLLQLPAGFKRVGDTLPFVTFNLDLNCRESLCSVPCTVDMVDDCEIQNPLIANAIVKQVILTGEIDFVVTLFVQSTTCGPLPQDAFVCCNVTACVDNPICIFSADTELVNCDGPFCPTVRGSIVANVEIGEAKTICGKTAYEAVIVLTFVQDRICNNFLPTSD